MCPYCDEEMTGEEAINLDGQLFCPDCAECEFCGKEAVTQRPTFLCEQCQEDMKRGAALRAKYIRLTEGE